jgi:hypothetical protein
MNNKLFSYKTMNAEEEKIWQLRDELNRNNLNLDKIRRQIRQLSDFDETKEYDYLNALLYPEKIKGVRIPCKTPMPTCTFQLRQTITNTYSYNDRLFIITPYYLGIEEEEPYDMAVNSIDPDTGDVIHPVCTLLSKSPCCVTTTTDPENALLPFFYLSLNQNIDPGIYSMYRLVSASVHIQYFGELNYARGTIGGGICIDENNYLTCEFKVGSSTTSRSNNKMKEYVKYNNIRHLSYFKENNLIEGIRLLYFPVDNRGLEFKKLVTYESIYQVGMTSGNDYSTIRRNLFLNSDNYDNRFSWLCFLENTPVNSHIKIDLYCNFECVPDYKMLNYIPISVNCLTITEEKLNEIWKKIRSQCIEKLV